MKEIAGPDNSLNADSSYDALAPHFRSYSATRAAYLGAVDGIILQSISPWANSMLDVGSGDGARAAKLAGAGSLNRLVLSDPSEVMAGYCRRQPAASVWRVAAEDLPDATDAKERFDLITCLWNVLGLVADNARRVRALRRMSALLSARGQLFLDVNNRYNARAYGWMPVFGRAAYDLFRPSEANGDVSFSWQVGGRSIRSSGHVFRPLEMSALIEEAGLRVVRRWVLDYETGERRRFAFEGQLLYELVKR